MDEPASVALRAPAAQTLAPYLAFTTVLAAYAVIAVRHARTLWFFGDDFDFLLNRGVSLGGDHGLLVPHNEHWSTVPILLFRGNFALFGLRHYLPYALMPIVCHLLICVLVLVLLRLAGVTPWTSSLVAVVAVFSAGGAGVENTLWDFQVGFLGSAFFGLAGLTTLVADRCGAAGRVAAVGLLVLSLMSSGMGIVMVIWVATFLVARDGVRSAALVIAVPVAVYVAWYAGYGHGHSGAPAPDLSVAPVAAMRGLGGVWSAASGVPGAGAFILVAMVAAVVLGRHTERLFALAGSGLVTLVASYGLLGYSRSGLGIDAAVRSRYIYFGVLLTLPALACALGLVAHALRGRAPRVSAVAWFVTAAVVLSVGSAQEARWAESRRDLIGDNLHRVAAAGELVGSGAALLRSMPMPDRNPDVSVSALSDRSVRDRLPRVRPGRAAELYVAAHLQVDVSPTPRMLPAPTSIRWRNFGPALKVSGPGLAGCATRTAKGPAVIELESTQGVTEVRIRVNGSDLGTRLFSGDERSPVVHWAVQPGRPVYVASSAARASLHLLVPAGATTVCTG